MSNPKSVRGLGLKTRLVAGFLAVGIIPLIVLGWYGYQRSVDSILETTSDRLEEAAIVSGDLIDRNLFERYNDVQAFASNPAAIARTSGRQRFMNDLTTSYGVYDLMLVVDLDGRVVGVNSVDHTGAPIDSASLVGTDVSAEEWFQVAVAADRSDGAHYTDAEISPYVTEVYGEERLSLPFAAPIIGPIGTSGVWYNLTSFERVVTDVMAETRSTYEDQGLVTVETQVIRPDGVVLDDADPAAVLQVDLVEHGLEAAIAATGAAGTSGSVIETNTRRGVEQINAFAVTDGALGFDGYGWGILVREDVAEAIHLVDGIRSAIVVIGLILLVMIAIGGALMARSVADPMRDHAALLAGVADGDLSLRLDTRAVGEVGGMAVAINTALDGVGSTLADVDQTAFDLAESATGLTELSQRMSETASATSTRATVAATSAEEISVTSDSVARAMEQMSASVKEISDSTTEAARVSAEAVEVTVSTKGRMEALESSASDIGDVVNVITSIAEQTDLLALNATIEAARVGEAGKGFAVVANEVKALASQTSTATDEIKAKVDAIQREAIVAVQAIADISQLIEKVNHTSTTIADAVEKQSITTEEVTTSLLAVTDGTVEISHNIAAVADAASIATDGAAQTRGSARHLANLAEQLNQVLDRFELGQVDRSGAAQGSVTAGASAEPTALPSPSSSSPPSSLSSPSPLPVTEPRSGSLPAPPVTEPHASTPDSTRPAAPASVPASTNAEAPGVEYGAATADDHGDRPRPAPEPTSAAAPTPPAPPSQAATTADRRTGAPSAGRLEELESDLVEQGWR